MDFATGLTLTFGDVIQDEMPLPDREFNLHDLSNFREIFENMGAICELHCLNEYMSVDEENYSISYLLIIRNGVQTLNPYLVDNIYREHYRVASEHIDVKFNIQFDLEENVSYYNNRVISYNQVPNTKILMNLLSQIVNENYLKLNVVYNSKLGFGYHGDVENKKLIGVRIGKSGNIVLAWMEENRNVGEKIRISLNNGDIYFFSSSAN